MHVYVRNSKGEPKRVGKIRSTVFHPTELRALGYSIHRPDALLMVKRRDRFVALDRVEPFERGLIAIDAADSWDDAACKRLGVDYDSCIIWDYMPVRTESGKELGTIANVEFNPDTYLIDHIDVSANAVDRTLLGSSIIRSEQIVGYVDGAIVVKDSDDPVEVTGGAAAQAGIAWAKAKQTTSDGARIAGEKINDGAYKAGELIGTARAHASCAAQQRQEKKRQAEANGEYVGADKAANLLGKQLGRASGMFKSFKEEFDRASSGDEDG